MLQFAPGNTTSARNYANVIHTRVLWLGNQVVDHRRDSEPFRQHFRNTSRCRRKGVLKCNYAENNSKGPTASYTPPRGERELPRLLSGPKIGKRARSASDAGVLRRKGRLKEQDQFIDFIVSMHQTHSCHEAMSKLEFWVKEHRKHPTRSQLKRLVPAIGAIFTDLPLVDAFNNFDDLFALSRRRFVRPNFAEIRHILNMAQIKASAKHLQLITFDADGTLYADGTHLEQDNMMIDMMIALMERGVFVGIVTAAGYPGEPELFEARIKGLLDAFQLRNLSSHVTQRFIMLGGECNYLLQYSQPKKSLQFVPDKIWMSKQMLKWNHDDIKHVLDSAEDLLVKTAASLRVPVVVVRKEKAVGVVPKGQVVYEVLEEMAITCAAELVDMPVPFCAFNGGGDVFVDIGNKSLGLHALMKFVGANSSQTLHVGDRFTASGNDAATRDCCSILWVAAPEETCFFIDMLLSSMESLPCLEAR